MKQDTAEEIGLRALGWLASDEELFTTFMGSTGAGLDDVQAGAGDPVFLASILDFVMMDDAWVTRCCDALTLPYETIARARMALPGGQLPDWT